MKAVLLTNYGAVENLELSDVPEPETGPGQLKVRVVAGSINPVDRLLRRGDLRAWTPLGQWFIVAALRLQLHHWHC